MAKVTIIIPCFNQGKYLEECLYSVANQTFIDWECLMINDGSTDNTEEICKSWLKKDSRFKYIKKENSGVSASRNQGLNLAKGEWILFLDGDDYISNEKFEKSLKFHENYNLIVTNFNNIITGKTAPPFCQISQENLTLKHIIEGWDVYINIPIHCALLKNDLIGNTRFPEDLSAKEDWLFWIAVFGKANIKPYFLDESLSFYRMNASGASKNFLRVYKDLKITNQRIFEQSNPEIRAGLFQKLNNQNYELQKTNLDQKNYIRKLQNTKILKMYLYFRKFF